MDRSHPPLSNQPHGRTDACQGDPNCKEQETFAPSSTWMPPFMRVNPILDWDYGHIWRFLRYAYLRVCACTPLFVCPPPSAHPPVHTHAGTRGSFLGLLLQA